MTLTVSELAERTGVTGHTVRYYERIGLLPEPRRSRAGYRLYEARAVDRLRFIREAKHLGLRLEEIKELLEIRDRGLCPCGHTKALLRKRIGEIEEELARLGSLREDLVRMLETWDEAPDPGDGQWHCAGEMIAPEELQRR